MSDRWAVVLALCTAAGAALPHGLPRWPGVAVALVALAARRPALLCVGAAVLASALSHRSWAGLDPPSPAQRVVSRATLVTDPVDVDGAVKVELRLAGGRRVEAWARGRPAADLRPRLAGERLDVAGRLSPVTGRRRAHLARRHVAARLTVAQVGRWSPGGRPARLANDLRRTLLRGAASLPDRHRALFTGFVLGDDREQDAGSVDDFRAAGLSHLLAVSGQNVAFVLALAVPLLRWLGLRGRLVAGLCVLAGFGLLTRWEPSVLRAEAMATVTLVAATLGRPASTIRVLALAVAGLLLVDPLLVGSVGFLLSSGACAGIALLAGPLHARRVPLPLAVTLAAQAGVAPVMIPVFGSVPVAALPANLLAVPAAGPVMVWGLAAGLPAGLVGGGLASLVHLPTHLLVGWISGVARWCARLPLGQLRAAHAVALALVGVAVAVVRGPRRALVLAVGAGVLLWAAGPGAGPVDADGRPVGGGARLWSGGGKGSTVLVISQARAGPLLADLRDAGVRHLDLVVVARDSARVLGVLAVVLDRHPARMVLTSATAEPGDALTTGRLRVDVLATRPRLEVRVRPCTVARCAFASGLAPTTSPTGPSSWGS